MLLTIPSAATPPKPLSSHTWVIKTGCFSSCAYNLFATQSEPLKFPSRLVYNTPILREPPRFRLA